jgi:alkaline phosphatase
VLRCGLLGWANRVLGTDGLPFTVVGFLNGAGSILQEGGPNEIIDGARPNVSQEEASAPDYEQQSLIPKDSETHSATVSTQHNVRV